MVPVVVPVLLAFAADIATPTPVVTAPPVSAAAPTPAPTIADGDRLLDDAGDDAKSYEGAIAVYDALLAAAPSADVYAKKSKALLRLGDVQKTDKAKQAMFDKGVAAADAGIALNAKCAECWFWRSANRGRWGQVQGVLKSLFLLDEVKGGFQKVLALQPGHADAKLSLGLVDKEVPGFAGGSVERAEAAFRAVIKEKPAFTRARLDLAELCWSNGKKDEALALAQGVVDEKAPLYRGDHRKFDVKRARGLLASWR
jgi:tetratricopeptide (TPR) repeat protein